MSMMIEHEGEQIEVWTKADLDKEIVALKVTNKNLKDEKTELAEKLNAAKEQAQQLELSVAEANGDKEKAQRLADEIKAAKDTEHVELINAIKSKEVNQYVNSLVTKYGAGGQYNEDLADLIRGRHELDYDVKLGAIKVSGSGVDGAEALEKLVAESDRYSSYRAGSGASGGDSLGSKGTGAALSNNPFKKGESFNLTEQARISRESPEQAAALKSQASA